MIGHPPNMLGWVGNNVHMLHNWNKSMHLYRHKPSSFCHPAAFSPFILTSRVPLLSWTEHWLKHQASCKHEIHNIHLSYRVSSAAAISQSDVPAKPVQRSAATSARIFFILYFRSFFGLIKQIYMAFRYTAINQLRLISLVRWIHESNSHAALPLAARRYNSVI